jgi:hypothetical protein
MVPTYPPSATAREQDLKIEEGTAVDDDGLTPIETRRERTDGIRLDFHYDSASSSLLIVVTPESEVSLNIKKT